MRLNVHRVIIKMFNSKVTLFIILASLISCDCLFQNIFQNIGKTVSGVYRCSRNIVTTPATKQNFYDLRLEIKDGKVQIWLPDTGTDQMGKMSNKGTPEISANSRINTPVIITDYPEIRTRTMRDLSTSGSHMRFQESRIPYINPVIPNYPVYQNMIGPMVMPVHAIPEYKNPNKYLDPPLPPPPIIYDKTKIQPEQNFDKNSANSIKDMNLTETTSGRSYKTLPYSEYSENNIGNGLMETDHSLSDYIENLLKRIPLYNF